jgi:hypothetical protein
MKYFVLILIFGFCLTCHRPTINQNTKIFEKDILNSYIEYTLSKRNIDSIYINKNVLRNHNIVHAIETIKWQEYGHVKIKKNIGEETKSIFFNRENLDFFYSQLPKVFTWSSQNLDSKKIILFDQNKDINNREKVIRIISNGLKKISLPIYTIDKKSVLIFESSDHAGLVILVFKKIKDNWQFHEYIDI